MKIFIDGQQAEEVG